MLEQIVNSREKSNLILIIDDNHTNGNDLLFAFLHQQSCDTHLYLFDHFINDVRNVMLPSMKDKVSIHDYFKNLYENDYMGNIFNAENHQFNNNSTVFIDSLSTFIHSMSIQFVCKKLLECASKCNQLIALVHSDLHNEDEIKQLKYIANTVLTLRTNKAKEEQTARVCDTFHVAKSGQITKISETFQIVNHSLIHVKKWSDDVIIDDKSGSESEEDDPTSNLTFNLSLNEKEEEARSKLVLPYIKKKHLDVKVEDKATKGFIYYEPDEVDDFDEEDPDDDLDF